MDFPKLGPEFFFQRVHSRVTGDDCTAKLPFLGMLHHPFLPRIVHDVKAELGKGVTLALFGSQNVIVRLMLEAMRSQLRDDVFAQEFHAVLLVGVAPQAHPDQMNVVRHQAIGQNLDLVFATPLRHQLDILAVILVREKRLQPTISPLCYMVGKPWNNNT